MPSRISVIVPCYNEEATICQLLDAIYRQSFPREKMEVVIADGLSKDGTLDRIDTFRNDHPDLKVQVISNPAQTIPSGLNAAIRVAIGNMIIRMDAHSQPYPDYVMRCVAALEAGAGDNVGGIWEIKPGSQSWVSKAIAVAAAHPLGVGDARYRIGTQASEVDTVPFGAFRTSLLERIGMFDESLLTNEDYEFNARIRKSGGRIWLDPDIVSVYVARSSIPELARQYWRYGYWKFRMLLRYPETLRWRQALPPLLVLSFLVLLPLAWWSPAKWILTVEVILYVFILLLVGVHAALRRRDATLVLGLPLAIGTMHNAWGAGFLASIFAGNRGSRANG